KGGTGATTLATNLAGALQREDKRVLLVDLDRQLGDVLVFLDMAGRYTIPDVLQNIHRLDRELFLSSLARHSPGVYVLPQPDYLEGTANVGAPPLLTPPQLIARHFHH